MESNNSQTQMPVQSIVQISLVLLLVVAAFFIGMLWTKVQNLEKDGGNNNVAANQQGAAVPEQPGETLGDVAPIGDADHIRGNKDAKVAMIVYTDFECPYCKRFHPTASQLLSENDGKVKWIYRHLPLESIHPNAMSFALGSECVAKLAGNDAFWKYSDALFEAETPDVYKIAASVGVNAAAFKSCHDNEETFDKVKADMASASSANIRGTPGAILWNLETNEKELIPGAVPYATLKTSLDNISN